MIRQTKEMMTDILGECEIANYFIIDELNPDAWGFDGISMTVRRAGK
jgi:4-oxalocrotonate tautomerase